MTKRLEVYKDEAGEYRWRLVAENGKLVSDSGESYVRRIDAVEEAKSLFGTSVDYAVEGTDD